MTISISQFDGPRLLQPDELYRWRVMLQICFGGSEVDKEDVPGRYKPPKRGGIYVLAHQGKLVSLLEVTHAQISLCDATIRVASIGGVCTHPDYRNQGLATHLLEYCTEKVVAEGARLLLISGAHNIYTRLGNVPHGRFTYVTIKPNQNRLGQPTPADLVVRAMTQADIPAVSRLYQAEPVHFIRQQADFATAVADPLNNPYLYAQQWVIERAGEVVAYLFLGNPYGTELAAGIRQVSEYAGSRVALVNALNWLLTTSQVQELSWPVPWQDWELLHLLQEGGYSGSLAPLYGHTWRIVNFPGLIKDLRPVLQARLGASLRRDLRFAQSGSLLGGTGTDRYTISRGPDHLELDGAAMTRLVMGHTESETEPRPLPGALAEVIPALFPLPSFLPGLNYL